ncbi:MULTISPECIES: hypothetical protein [Niastella]|uniref:Uncharacterized protein n=1 Tax=Niastella soli TaxID=2821487 RepID=A0ABS3Z2B8_9BACT|nr:hypothetical protein [Niastella soli]MBO9204293.1 hypothetical protein [Niastella soli]
MKKMAILLSAWLMGMLSSYAQEKVDITVDNNTVNATPGSGKKITVKRNGTIEFSLKTPEHWLKDHKAALSIKGKEFKFTGHSLTFTDDPTAKNGIDLSSTRATAEIDGKKLSWNIMVAMEEAKPKDPKTADVTTDAPEADKDEPTGEPDRKPYRPGSMYYDAIALATPHQLTEKEWDDVVNFYFKQKLALHQDLVSRIKNSANNPFLAESVNTSDTFLLKIKGLGAAQSGGGSILSQALTSIGGIDVTTIVDGFAKFIVKRTKQELAISFFDKFKDMIAKEKDLQSVFPETYQALTVIGDQIYNYQAYIQTLRESFEKDLSTLAKNLPSIIDNHQAFFDQENKRWLKATLLTGSYVTSGLQDHVHPGDLLADYPAEYLDSLLSNNWKGAVQTLQLISLSLRDTASNKDSAYWVSPRQVRELIANSTAFNIYLGLMYETEKTFDKTNGAGGHIYFKDSTVTLQRILDAVHVNLAPFRTFITQFGEKAGRLNTMIRQYKKAASDSLMLEQYYAYFTATVDLLQQSSKVTSIPAVRDLVKVDLGKEMTDYFDISRSFSNLVLNVNRRNYAAAIINTTHIYDVIRIKWSAKNPDVQGGALFDAPAAVKASKDEIFKYGGFMAALVQAKSSDEVENAIEAIALPTGSARIKRETPFNISLNAYGGLFLGHESIAGIKNKKWINSYGITAPIGVAFSTSSHHLSYSLFLSVVDIGAVAAFRFADTLTSKVPVIELKNIVSPGAFFSLGLPRSPVSINLGAQMGPNLRKVYAPTDGKQSNDYANQTYWRFSVSVCVDIPVLNFYTRSAK